MGREVNDPIMIQSSIALLQQRFKQLQRAKEMREVRELSRNLLEPKPFNPTNFTQYDQPSNYSLFISPELIFQPRSPATNISPSLWWNSHSKVDDQSVESPVFMSLRPARTTSNLHAFSSGVDKSGTSDDVDTSLHL